MVVMNRFRIFGRPIMFGPTVLCLIAAIHLPHNENENDLNQVSYSLYPLFQNEKRGCLNDIRSMNNTCAISDSQGSTQTQEKGLFFTNGSMLRTQNPSTAVNECGNNMDFNVQSLKQELAALTGCVSRCRTVFSPEPAAALLSGAEEDEGRSSGKLPHRTREDNDYCDCLDCQSFSISDNSTGQLVRQHSSEYDHLDDFSSAWNDDGHMHEDKPCAVSVHFRTYLPSSHVESERLGDEIKVVPCIQSASCSSRQYRCVGEQISLGDTADSAMHFTDQYLCHHSDLAISTSVGSPHLSTWPRNHKRKVYCSKVNTCMESMPLALNLTSTDGSRSTLRISQSAHTQGSSSSIKSLHSLCCEKPFSPYRKGIDAVTFKMRMEVRNVIPLLSLYHHY